MNILKTMAYTAVAAVAAYNMYLATDIIQAKNDLTFENIAFADNSPEQTGGESYNGVWTRVGSYSQMINYYGTLVTGYIRVYYKCQAIIPSSTFKGECVPGTEKTIEDGSPLW
ncbi:MAG: hypothetical protein J6Y82_01180 [Bacteroidales bacterium]|nr:hypothetical protein [Bacteroidales bacterium]